MIGFASGGRDRRGLPRLLLALGLGLATMSLTRSWLDGQSAEARAAQSPDLQTVEILVAASPIAIGATLQPADLRWQPWPKHALAAGYIVRSGAEPPAMTGAVARTAIAADEPLTAAKAVQPGDHGTLAALIHPGFRAVTVAVSDAAGLAGFLIPGDHVDLVLTHPAGAAGERRAARTVLADVPVLGVDDKTRGDLIAAMTEARSGHAAASGLVTLEVRPRDAERIALAAELGKLSLALRGVATDPAAPHAGPSWETDVTGLPPVRAAAPAAAQPAALPVTPALAQVAPAAQSSMQTSGGIEILHGLSSSGGTPPAASPGGAR